MKIYFVFLIHAVFLIQLYPQSGQSLNGLGGFNDNKNYGFSIPDLFNFKSSNEDNFLFLDQNGLNKYQKTILLKTAKDSADNSIIHSEYDSTSQNGNVKSKSFFKSNLFYFLGTAVAVITVYFVLHRSDKPSNTVVTFGLPPSPK